MPAQSQINSSSAGLEKKAARADESEAQFSSPHHKHSQNKCAVRCRFFEVLYIEKQPLMNLENASRSSTRPQEHATFDQKRAEHLHERYKVLVSGRTSTFIDRNGTLPTRFAAVKVLGSPNTRPAFLSQVVDPLRASEHSQGLKTCLDRLTVAAERLEKFGIYDSISVEVDQSSTSQTDQLDLAATIRVRERSRTWKNFQVNFGGPQGSTATAAMCMRNVFGGAESLEGNMSVGTQRKNSYELRFASPVRADPNTILDILGFKSLQNNANSSYCEENQGIVFRLRHASQRLAHSISLSMIDRQVLSSPESASLAARQCAGLSRKISISHSVTRDTRVDGLVPSSGSRMSIDSELAGCEALGGNASFLKVGFAGSKHIPLDRNSHTVLHLATRSGFLWSFDKQGKTYLPDRFQLGGPQIVGGIMQNGLGPRSQGDSLGGELFLANELSLTTPLPYVKDVHLHMFVNTGSLLNLNRENFSRNLQQLALEPSVGTGGGLIFRLPFVGRVKASLTLPITARATDNTQKGLQNGFCLEPL